VQRTVRFSTTSWRADGIINICYVHLLMRFDFELYLAISFWRLAFNFYQKLTAKSQ
jgi:hypothetical protein